MWKKKYYHSQYIQNYHSKIKNIFVKLLKIFMKNRKKIIVTGGSGYLGKYIVDELLTKYHVISVDRKNLKLINKNYTMVKSSIKNFFRKKNLTDIYAIIHLATVESRSNLYVNNPELAFQNLSDMYIILDRIKKFNKKPILIFTSSKQIENDNKNYIKNPYSLSKEFCENLIKFYSKNYKIQSYILRISDIFSLFNNPPKKALMVLINKFIKHEKVNIHDTDHFFEYVSVQDIVNGIMKLLSQKKHKTKQINFYGKKIMISKLVEMIKRITKSKSKIQTQVRKKKRTSIEIEFYKMKKKWAFHNRLKSIIKKESTNTRF